MVSMVESSRVKIIVRRITDSKQIFGDNPPVGQAMEACTRFKVGQSFIVEKDGQKPDGFCTWAWDDLTKAVTTLRFGGNFPWMNDKGTGVFCCTDGFRPVIFELRRIT